MFLDPFLDDEVNPADKRQFGKFSIFTFVEFASYRYLLIELQLLHI